jgi:hypothetical protein
MAVTAVGTLGSAVSAHGGGHWGGNPIDAIADLHDAQDAYNAGQYMTANRRAIVAIASLRSLGRRDSIGRQLQSIGCGTQYGTWFDRALTKMLALRAAAFGQGTRWAWAENPRRARVLGLAVYRRAAARYDTAENALIDCVLDRLPEPPDWVFDLGF